MLVFIIETLAACLLLTAGCLLSTRRLMDNLELAKLNYPPEIVQRLIERGLVSGTKPPSEWQRIKKKWPAMLVLGLLIGLLMRCANGCAGFLSGFGTAYLLWLIVDWYDALIVDCVLFCHSRRFVIPGTEDLSEAYHDYMFHIKGSRFGMLIGLPCCLIAGGVTML